MTVSEDDGMKESVIDPTLVRLSKHFMLSDFMGCDSVYRKGLTNRMPVGRNSDQKILEGKRLAEYLDTLIDDLGLGPCSVSYGYISPFLSKKIVTYRDPSAPSYHRWDDGAAADVVFHEEVTTGVAPIHIAHRIDYDYPQYSRMITYSESPYICIATKVIEDRNRDYRLAFYENRYVGKTRPVFIRKSSVHAKRREQIPVLDHHWEGNGFPTYHGGGRKQFQHWRLTEHFMLSDLMFDKAKLLTGERAYGVRSDGDMESRFLEAYLMFAKLLEAIVHETDARVSVIQGLKPSTHPDGNGIRHLLRVQVVPNGGYTDVETLAQCVKEEAQKYNIPSKEIRVVPSKQGKTSNKLGIYVYERGIKEYLQKGARDDLDYLFHQG